MKLHLFYEDETTEEVNYVPGEEIKISRIPKQIIIWNPGAPVKINYLGKK